MNTDGDNGAMDQRPLFNSERRTQIRMFEDDYWNSRTPNRSTGQTAISRARVHTLHQGGAITHEARLGKFVVRADESSPMGAGSAPSPWQYLVAAVGF